MLWAISDWRRRQGFIWSFCLTMGVLLAASQLILPGWISEFRAALFSAYREYIRVRVQCWRSSPGLRWGNIFLTLAVIVLLVTADPGWRLRHADDDSPAFSAMTTLVMAATGSCIAPSFAPYNQVLLLPAIFLIILSWSSLWHRNLATRIACVIGALVFFWHWLASSALLFASLILPPDSVQQGWSLPLRNSLLLPVMVLGLYVLSARDRLKLAQLQPAGATPSASRP